MTLPLQTLAHWRTELEAGRISSLDLTEAALDGALQGAEGPTTFTVVHAETARATARAVDLRRAAGLPGAALGPLAGLPVSIKDLFDEAGQVTRAGSTVLADTPAAAQDAVVVQRLRAAGAVLVGRTNMTEFAFSGLGLNPHHGTPRNPWDRCADAGRGHIPGGSSSGAAISVTDGMAVAAIGTDTGGSVRIPAALCGLTGFKPTARRVPLAGCLPLSTTLDSIGPLAPTVACCAWLDAVLAGERPEALQPRPLAGVVLAQPSTLVFEGLDDPVAAAWASARRVLSDAGARVVEVAVPEFAELAQINRHGGFAAAEAWSWHADWVARAADRYDPRVVVRIRRGQGFTAADYLALHGQRLRWIAAVQARLAAVHAAAWLLPTVPVVAPPVAILQDDDAAYTAANVLMLRNPTLINFLDGCAISLPCHPPGGAPVGLMLAAGAGQDAALLALAAGVESALARKRTP